MSNTFVTPQAVVRDAAIFLAKRLFVASHISRDAEKAFGNKVGDTVKVRTPMAVSEASELTTTTAAEAVSQTSVDVTLEKHFYKRATLTSKEQKLSLDDFTRTITAPFMSGIALSIDKFLIRKMQIGLAAQYSGTVTSRPSTAAHFLAAHKKLDDAYVTQQGRVGLIDTTVKQSLLADNAFINMTYGADNALKDLELGSRLGATWVPDPASAAFDRGDVAGTLDLGANVSAGATTFSLDGFTAATGTLKAGTALTIAGDTTRYVVTADAAIASNSAASVSVTPAIAANALKDAVVTVEGTRYGNFLFVPGAVAGAIVAPDPLPGMQSVTYTFDGVTVRFSQDGSISTLSSDIVFDVLVGGVVVNPTGAVIVGG